MKRASSLNTTIFTFNTIDRKEKIRETMRNHRNADIVTLQNRFYQVRKNNWKKSEKSGGQRQNRTADTQIFSLLLYRLSYLAAFEWSKL
jgi:hypothetical protein